MNYDIGAALPSTGTVAVQMCMLWGKPPSTVALCSPRQRCWSCHKALLLVAFSSSVLWVISLPSLCWFAVRPETILFCIHLLLDRVRRGRLKSIEITQLGIPTKPLFTVTALTSEERRSQCHLWKRIRHGFLVCCLFWLLLEKCFSTNTAVLDHRWGPHREKSVWFVIGSSRL